MKIADIEKEPLVMEWFANIEAAQTTRRNFLQGMKYYTEFVKKSPNELLEEAEEEIKSGILMRKRKIRGYLLGFRDWLKEQGYAPKTVYSHMVAAKSFYKSFDIDLPQLNNKKQFQVLPTEENGIRLEKDNIKMILKHANIRNRAIILVMSSSGLSQSDVLDLTVGDFNRGFDEKTMITTLQLRRIKTRYDFITFLSPEATKAIMDYLEYRNRKPKENNPDIQQAYEKRRLRSDKDFIFCKHDIPDSYLKTFDENERRLNTQGLMDLFRELAKKTGLDTEKGQWQIVRAHNLRKFFNSELLNNGADMFLVDFMMGHKIDSVHEAYFKADPKKLKDRYMRYLPYLALTDTETYILETEEYTQLRAENEELRKQVREIKTDLDSRKGADDTLNMLFSDPQVQELLLRKMKELEGKRKS